MKKLLSIMLSTILIYSTSAQRIDGHFSKDVTGKFVGVWSLVSVENIGSDGTKTFPYGSRPQGLLVFESNGDYAIQILKAARPKVAADDKNKGTPEEYAALVQGNNSHFGTYLVDGIKQIITFNVKHAFYPNWEGAVQNRSYTFENNVLRYVVSHTTNGGAIKAVVVWKKK